MIARKPEWDVQELLDQLDSFTMPEDAALAETLCTLSARAIRAFAMQMDGALTRQAVARKVQDDAFDDQIGPGGKPAGCRWCGKLFPSGDIAKQHAYECKESPLVQEITKLKEQIKGMSAG